MLRTIRDDGVRVQTKQGEDALAVAGCAMRFPMAHGAAVITERSIKGFVDKAIGELCAFINGARTLDELAEFGCDWWDAWATPEKSRLARAGARRPRPRLLRPRVPQLHDRPRRRRPGLRPAPAPDPEAARPAAGPHGADEPVDPAGQPPRRADVKSRNTIAPCHGWIHALVFGDKLHLSTTSAPATRRSASRPTWPSTPRWA